MDAAHLSREVCGLVKELGRDPYTWPKKNAVHNAKESSAWALMVRLFENDPGEFMLRTTTHGPRPGLPSTPSGHGNALRRTNRISQRRKIGLGAICHNINAVNKPRAASRLGLY